MSSAPNLSEINFMAVIFPEAKPASGNYGPRPKTTRLEGEGWIGARVESEENVYFGFFRTEASASNRIEGYTTDASRFTVSLARTKDIFQSLYFEGTLFKFKDLEIQSTEPVTCTFDKTKSFIEIQVDKATLFSFSSEDKPKSIVLNGDTLTEWKYDKATRRVSLKLMEGRHGISIY